MAIVIDGTGTISGVSAGGLPDGVILTADIADAAITAAKLSGASNGSAPIYAARAWVNFNGTGTVAIRASGNVSSITDNGTGDYTVNFTTAMSDANYAISGMSGFNNAALVAVMQPFDLTPQATGSVRIQTAFANTSLADYSAVRIAIFR